MIKTLLTLKLINLEIKLMNIKLAKTINLELSSLALEHEQFKEALNKSKALLNRQEFGLTPSGFFLSGPSGTGKTTLLNEITKNGHDLYGPDSVIHTTLTGSTNFTQIITSILTAAKDPLPQNGTGNNKLERLIKSLLSRGTRLVIIDEFQHMLAAKTISPKILNDAANAIKSIMDKSGASFIIAGTADIVSLWDFDYQLRTRFQSPSSFTPFHYPENQKDWGGIVKAFEKTINKQGVSIECSGLPHRLFTATHGNMRSVVSILKEAVVNAISNDSLIISDDELNQATQVVMDSSDGNLKAFTDSADKIKLYAGSIPRVLEVAPRAPSLNSLLSQS
jgi:Cdc6-like AAA superfamily ATPase